MRLVGGKCENLRVCVSARSGRRCLFMNKGMRILGYKPTIVFSRCCSGRPSNAPSEMACGCCLGAGGRLPSHPHMPLPRSVGENPYYFFCVHEHRRWPSGVFMNNAPLWASVFLTDRPNDQGMRR